MKSKARDVYHENICTNVCMYFLWFIYCHLQAHFWNKKTTIYVYMDAHTYNDIYVRKLHLITIKNIFLNKYKCTSTNTPITWIVYTCHKPTSQQASQLASKWLCNKWSSSVSQSGTWPSSSHRWTTMATRNEWRAVKHLKFLHNCKKQLLTYDFVYMYIYRIKTYVHAEKYMCVCAILWIDLHLHTGNKNSKQHNT